MMALIKKQIIIASVLLFVVFFFSPHLTHAQNTTGGIAGAVIDYALGGVVDTVSTALSWVAYLVFKIISLVTALAGLILNSVVYHTVVNMGTYLNGDSFNSINTTWTLIRDVANMGFIFMLLYASIMTIIGRGGEFKGLIVRMIVAAVLVNFSLFFTKVIIDASNVLALTFYGTLAPLDKLGEIATYGISNGIIDALKAQSFLANTSSYGVEALGTNILSIITLLAVAFVLFAASVMFIVRFVALILTMILSPIMVLAGVFPNLSGYRKQWWDTLIGQSFFAPVFFIMMWITLTLVTDITNGVFQTGGVANMAEIYSVSNQLSSLVPVMLNFSVIIAFVIGSLVISKSVAGKAAFGINNLSKWVTGAVTGASLGAVGFAGRKTLGRFGAWAAENPDLVKRANTQGTNRTDKLAGASARLGLYAAKKLQSGSFDARNATVPTESIGDLVRGTVGRTKIGKAIGANDFRTSSIEVGQTLNKAIGVGEAQNKGYKELEDEKNKRIKTEDRAREEDAKKAQGKIDSQKGLDAIKARKVGGQFTQADIDNYAVAVGKMSDKEISEMKASILEEPEIARNLSPRQLEAIQKIDPEKMSDTEKKNVFNSHFAEIKTAVEALSGGAVITPQDKTKYENLIKNLSDKELELLPTNIFDPSNIGGNERTVIKTLNQSQIDTLVKNRNVAEKQAIKDERGRPIKEAFDNSNWPEAIKIMREMKVEDLVKMSKDNLSKPGVLKVYSIPLLNKMASRSDFSEDKASAIRRAILDEATRPGITPDPEVVAAANWISGPGQNIF